MRSDATKPVCFGDLIEGGTRNGVYKPKEFHGRGAKIIEVNPEPTPLSSSADFAFLAKAGEMLPIIDEHLSAGRVGA